MQLISPEALTALTIAIYLLATFAGFCGMIWSRPLLRKIGCWLAIGAFFCQTLILIFGFHKLMPTGLSLGAYVQLLAWFFLLCGICAWQRFRQEAILLFAAPLGLILFLMSAPWLNLGVRIPPALSAPFYALHIGSLFLSLGLLALAFVVGLIFLVMERRIKSRKKISGIWEEMPALSILDRINAVCSIAAFPLYTIGVLAGLVWAKPVFGSVLGGDPKEITTLFIWFLLAILFYNRIARGWRGKKPAILAAIIFALSILSIVVINLFLTSHHGVIHG